MKTHDISLGPSPDKAAAVWIKGWIFLTLIAAGLCPRGHARTGELANADLRGLRVHTVEGVLRLKEEEVDLGTAALIISRNWGTTKTLHTYRRKIDAIAEEILPHFQARLPGGGTAQAAQ